MNPTMTAKLKCFTKREWYLVGLILALLISLPGVFLYAQATLPSVIIGGGFGVSPPTYTMFGSGTYYLQNGLTGAIDYYSTNATLVGEYAIANMVGGGELVIKSGNYPMVLDVDGDNITVRGEGYSTSINLPDNKNRDVIVVTGSRCKLQYLVVYGNKEHNTLGNGVMQNGSRCEITSVEAKNCSNIGFLMGGTAYALGGKYSNLIASDNDNAGIYFSEYATDIEITSCLLRRNGEAGLAMDNAAATVSHIHSWGNKYGLVLSPYHSASRLYFSDCLFADNLQQSVFYYGEHLITFVSFVSCQFWCPVSGSVGVYDSFYVYPTGTGRFMHNTITGCTFIGWKHVGSVKTNNYGFYAYDWRCSNNTITGNIFKGYLMPVPVSLPVGNYNTVEDNGGILTEDHGFGSYVNGGWVPYELSGEAKAIAITVYEYALYHVQVQNINATKFQLRIFNSTGLTTTDSVTIYWSVKWDFDLTSP